MLDLITKFNEEEAKIYYESDNHINCDKEIEKLKNRIHALEKHNQRLQLEAQKYFDLLMECEYGDKGEDKE